MNKNIPENSEKIIEELNYLRRTAPPGFAKRVLANLPERPGLRWQDWWEDSRRWLFPALIGAVSGLLIAGGVWWLNPSESAGKMVVHFEIHAPDANRVELVGTFTDWQIDRIELTGPDTSGHWTAELSLPPGRYEYLFLVDGRQWVTDPRADVRRADGFGRENAVLAL